MREKVIIRKLIRRTEKRLDQIFHQIDKKGFLPGADKELMRLMEILYGLLSKYSEIR